MNVLLYGIMITQIYLYTTTYKRYSRSCDLCLVYLLILTDAMTRDPVYIKLYVPWFARLPFLVLTSHRLEY
ncbi:hypothetical protein B0H10DRAFT_566713 [Mycena sp. CBHHK59/15]|nr:hypothetical protein B0H10DRAFT_566713 [Mycena sp. CBHHK59/15]